MNIDTDTEFLTKSIAKALNFLKNIGMKHTNIFMIISVSLVWAYFIYRSVEQGISIPYEVEHFVESVRLQNEWFAGVSKLETGSTDETLQFFESSNLFFSLVSFLFCFLVTFFARKPFSLLYENDTKKSDKELDEEINKEINTELGDLIAEQIEADTKQGIVEQTDDGLAKGIGKTLKVLIIRLKPVGLVISVLLISGITGIITTFFTNKLAFSYIESLFPVFCGLGVLLAYLLSLKFPPRLY